MSAFELCKGCTRHVHAEQSLCPFCGATMSTARAAAPRWALALFAGSMLAATSCDKGTAKTDDGKVDAGQSDAAKPTPAKPDAAKPDPAKPDPAKPDPAKPDPTSPPADGGDADAAADSGGTVEADGGAGGDSKTPDAGKVIEAKPDYKPKPKYGLARPKKKYGAPPKPGPGPEPF